MIIRVKSLFDNKIIRYTALAVMTILAIVSVVQGSRNAIAFSQDFQWDAARALCERIDPYELSLNPDMHINSESLSDFYRLFSDAGVKQKMEANQFPSLLMLLFPYVILKPFAARIAWLCTNLLFTLGIGWLLKETFLKNVSLYWFMMGYLFMIAGTPFRNQLGVGQHTIFSFFFFMLAVWLDEKRPEENSPLLAVCLFISYFKYTLTAPLALYILYKKRYLEFAVSVAMHVVATIVCSFWLDKSIVYMITAPLKVSSALSAEGGIDLGALFNGSAISFIIGGIIAIVLVIIAIKLPEGQQGLLFSILLMWSLILTYHRSYDFFVLSAVPISILQINAAKIKSEYNDYIGIYYYILLALVYFGLRVFSENLISRVVVGVFYYVFTLVITIISIYKIRKG